MEIAFRITLAVLLICAAVLAARHRGAADRSGGSVSRRSDPTWFWVGMSAIFPVLMGGFLLFILSPRWLEWARMPLPDGVRAAAIALAIVALVGFRWMFIHLGRNITPTSAPRDDATLVTSGPYRWVRHPMYSFGFLMFVSFSLITSSWLLVLAAGGAFLLLALRSRLEERRLVEKFGDPYRAYQRRTGRFLPRLLSTRGGKAAVGLVLFLAAHPASGEETRFFDSFDDDLSGWRLEGSQAISIADSGDPAHGGVLVLEPNGRVLALVEGSEAWGPVRLELDVLFPEDKDNYLGLIYNFTRTATRSDFGSLYIKGNGSYVRANPWRDGNVSRLLYEEYKTRLEGDDAIRIGRWQRVKAEIAGSSCHLYVGNMATPKVTFSLFEGTSGMVGLNPRVAGWPVWVDNVRVTSIEELAYKGPNIPDIVYEPQRLVTAWEVIGPLTGPEPAIERERDPNSPAIEVAGDRYVWRPFAVDPRGAVVTGRVTEFDGGRAVAYFRTKVRSNRKRPAVLHISTTDELALWVNGHFEGYVYRNGYVFGERDWNAWYDFWTNPAHAGDEVTLNLQPGDNSIVVRARNGQFASGGFFAQLQLND